MRVTLKKFAGILIDKLVCFVIFIRPQITHLLGNYDQA